MEPYTIVGEDGNNAGYVVIDVRGKYYSVPSGMEQSVANEIANNLDA